MKFKNEQQEVEEKSAIKDYWEEKELILFDRDLDKFRVERKGMSGNNFMFLSVDAEKRYLKQIGILSPSGGIYRKMVKDFTEHENKMRKLTEMKGKKYNAQRHRDNDLDKMAESSNTFNGL